MAMKARILGMAVALVLMSGRAPAQTDERARIDADVHDLALAHGVPESLVHRVILRESRYAPKLVSRGHYGLMQISLPTAHSMGYKGAAEGLLDAHTNLTYGIPYLANAWRVAGSSSDGAVRLYSSGYYGIAKAKNMLASLRTATSPSLAPPPPPVVSAPAPEEAPPREEGVGDLLGTLFGRAQPQASPTEPQEPAMAPEDAGTTPEATAEEAADAQAPERPVPLPPRRPAWLR
jgi:hypothetical protein